MGFFFRYNTFQIPWIPKQEKRRRLMGKRLLLAFVGALILFGLFLEDSAVSQDKPKAAVQPVAVEKLIPFLKDLQGWKAEGPAEGQTMRSGQGSYTLVFRSYEQGDKGLEVTLIDGAGVPQAYEDYEDLKAEVEAKGPNPAKSVTVGGFPGVELFEKESETATLMVLVKERFLLILDLDGATPKDDLKPLANQLDLKGLAALAGK
jgi:hypothetical protein